MSHQIRITIAATIAAFSLAPYAARAQSAAVRAPVGCTYETCALRVEPAFLSAPRLLRGREGTVVGHLSAFGGGVDSLLAGPDSAAVHARRYVTAVRGANTLALLGAISYVVVAVRTNGFTDGIDDTDRVIGLTGTALALAAIPFRIHAERSLSRAVWFYNAALAR